MGYERKVIHSNAKFEQKGITTAILREALRVSPTTPAAPPVQVVVVAQPKPEE
jgi:hypothetical protein